MVDDCPEELDVAGFHSQMLCVTEFDIKYPDPDVEKNYSKERAIRLAKHVAERASLGLRPLQVRATVHGSSVALQLTYADYIVTICVPWDEVG